MQLLPLLPVTNKTGIDLALFDDGLLAVMLLVEADFVFENEYELGREVVSYLLLGLAVVFARALHNVDLDHPRLLRVNLPIRSQIGRIIYALVQVSKHAEGILLSLVDGPESMLLTRQAQFLRAAVVALQLFCIQVKVAVFMLPPAKRSESDPSELGVQHVVRARVKWIGDCHGQVEALLRAEHIAVIKVVLLDCLDDCVALFAHHYVDFVARVRDQRDQKHD